MKPTKITDPEPPALQFVTYTSDPTLRQGQEQRVAIRSHVTRRYHRQQRQTDRFRPMTGSRPPFRPQTRSSGASSSSSSMRDAITSYPPCDPATVIVPIDDDLDDIHAGANPTQFGAATSSADDSAETTTTTEDDVSSASPSLSPSLVPGSMQEDPFWTFPVDYSPLFPPIIAHYIQNIALPVNELDGPTQTGLLRTHWFPMAMASPATMYAMLLMAASHYRACNGGYAGNLLIHSQHILLLKARALQEVNRTLRSSEIRSALSDAAVGAVAKLAAFEAIFGERDAYRQHMMGLMRMLKLRRDASSKLGTMDEFLARLVMWIDLNAAHFTGMKRVLAENPHELPIDSDITEPNPLAFAGTTCTRPEQKSITEQSSSSDENLLNR